MRLWRSFPAKKLCSVFACKRERRSPCAMEHSAVTEPNAQRCVQAHTLQLRQLEQSAAGRRRGRGTPNIITPQSQVRIRLIGHNLQGVGFGK